MKYLSVHTGWFTPFNAHLKRTGFTFSLATCALLSLTGCLGAGTSAPLAPMPPQRAALERNPIERLNAVQPAAGMVAAQDVGVPGETVPAHLKVMYPLKSKEGSTSLALSSDAKASPRCRLKDRFDRKVLIAYKWGRNRLGLDVDGINFGSADVEGVKLEYKLRLQHEKPSKEKCLYDSGWQGLIGSGYNELILRENDTVWQELREIRIDVQNRMDEIF